MELRSSLNQSDRDQDEYAENHVRESISIVEGQSFRVQFYDAKIERRYRIQRGSSTQRDVSQCSTGSSAEGSSWF